MSGTGEEQQAEVTDPTLEIEDVGRGVTVARIRRGPNNFFDEQLIAALATQMRRLAAERSARAVVLCSEGKHFCAGADFRRSPDNAGRTRGIYAWALDLLTADLPFVAAVQGSAVGGGVGLALAADLRVGAASTRFTANFARLGINQGFAITETLRDLIGPQKALDLLVTGRRVEGEEARSIGLLDRLVPEDQLLTAAIDEAAVIAANAPLAVRAIRSLLREGRAERLRQAIREESAQQRSLMQTSDFKEGVRATAERRPPVFGGE
jgi:2-(1,2-epoxy-1,2-dihydrophenyl)acetyl-CoA isomerase